MEPIATKVVRGVTLRADPARESCFKVVQDPSQLADYADMSDTARRQRLHKHVHNEMQAMEMAAQTLADFPDAPWDLRMSLARQCWDEARHSRVLHRRLLEVGGRRGEFPVMNFEWSVTCMADSIWARITIQNRTFEGGEIDLLKRLVRIWKEAGDTETAEILDGVLADEIEHVRYSNAWFKRLAKENPAALLKVGAAVHFVRGVAQALEPRDGETNAAGVDLTAFEHVEVLVNPEDRRLAGFSDAEIEQAVQQETAIVATSTGTAR
jgi:uncharacterized ferritin-like protein (DUF455 family)